MLMRYMHSQEPALAAARRVQHCLCRGSLALETVACGVNRKGQTLVILNQDALVLLRRQHEGQICSSLSA